MSRSRLSNWLVPLLALLVLLAGALPILGQSQTPAPPTPTAIDGGVQNPDQPAAATACSTPRTQGVRGKNITFDQCYQRNFSHGGTNYSIDTYYTETSSTTNTNQCNATENTAGRCEHALANNDDASGNNVNAVALAAEVETAMRFYIDRNLTILPSGTTLEIFIGEDPRLGGTPTTTGINLDDEAMDNNDTLNKRWLAFHEVQHLVQGNYDGTIGWNDFYGEGIARAIEDRVDTALDADTGHQFIPEVSGILSSDAQRTSDLSTINYRTVLWWTWLMDQYRTGGETAPVQGWVALRNFYLQLNTAADTVTAIRNYISGQGSSFRNDFIDYTLAMYSYRFNPSNARLGFLDTEIRNNAGGLSGHNVITGGPAFSTTSVTMAPRSSRYWEFNPANQCQFTTFSFNGNGKSYGFSVMTVDGGNLINRWTSFSNAWSRTVRTADLDRAVGIVTAVEDSGAVNVGRGCVTPTLNIKNPTTATFEMVGRANNPRKLIVRVKVTGGDGSSVAGLLASDFTVRLRLAGGGPLLNATIINSAYVQDDYWLMVQPPNTAAGAQNGEFYDLVVNLGTQSDTENSAVLYVKRTQDVVVVLDRSGSMTSANKIQAARNAADLFINELAADDQGAFVAFDTDAVLRVPLGQMAPAQRTALATAIAAEVPLNWTSIGDGMQTAATEEDARGVAGNLCSFVLLSDGYENEPALWADVRANVVDNGCAIHSIALGPEANEWLMQQIAGAVPGGSYDYANTSGSVPIMAAGLNAPAAGNAVAAIGWENNLSRVYDNKATQIAGRQKLLADRNVLDQGADSYDFYVDETSTELVLSIAWQKPSDNVSFELFDPDGNPVTPDEEIRSDNYTNIVLRVVKPVPGQWKMNVYGLYQEYIVSPTAETQFELYLYIGAPVDELNQGTKVPLLATFVGPEKPVVNADVIATVVDPFGQVRQVTLFDDGNHGDGEPDDGVYGGVYTATAFGDAPVPDKVIDGEEPPVIGSYQVKVVGIKGDIRREAQGSFAVNSCADENQNGLPDCWEKANGIDDPDGDPDGDGLASICELRIGTDPNDADTDDGGERDGSETQYCEGNPQDPNPLDPSDDRVGPLSTAQAEPESDGTKPVIFVRWSELLRGKLVGVDIYRRPVGPNGEPLDGWKLIAEMVKGTQYEDGEVEDGQAYEYRLVPHGEAENGDQGIFEPQDSTTPAVTASRDPYAPGGTILINDGDEATDSVVVTLALSADDSGESHDGGPADLLPGSPVEALEMRLSNAPDFTGADWTPFKPVVENWVLVNPGPGEAATVYVQFRDEAGNVSESGMGLADTILYQPGENASMLFLPVTVR